MVSQSLYSELSLLIRVSALKSFMVIDNQLDITFIQGTDVFNQAFNIPTALSNSKYGAVICFPIGVTRGSDEWCAISFIKDCIPKTVLSYLNDVLFNFRQLSVKISEEYHVSSIDEVRQILIGSSDPVFHEDSLYLKTPRIPAFNRSPAEFTEDFSKLVDEYQKHIYACISFSFNKNNQITAAPLPSQSVASLVKWIQPGDSRMFLTKESPNLNKNILVVSCIREQKVAALKAKVNLAVCKPFIMHALRNKGVIIDRSIDVRTTEVLMESADQDIRPGGVFGFASSRPPRQQVLVILGRGDKSGAITSLGMLENKTFEWKRKQ